MAKGKASQASPALPSALSHPWTFLRPTNDLHNLVADSAKRILDPLAASVVEEQSARRQANKKRKRSETGLDTHTPLQLKTLYVDGFTSNQIWEQAIRILDSAGSEVERDIALLAEHDVYRSSSDEEHSELLGVSDPEDTGSESDDADSISNVSSENASGDDLNEELDNESDSLDQEDLEAMSQIDEGMSDGEASIHSTEEDPGTYVEDRFGLNDGFFSIDEFNKQSEQLERQDAKGGADDDDDDDSDEEVDWHANPLLAGSAMPISKKDAPSKERRPDNDDSDDSSEEDGPTFGNVDLKAGFDSDEDDEDASHAGDADATGWIDTSDIKYADFFAPPPKKASSKKARALPKTQPAKPIMDEDVDRAMADVRRDLFDESEEEVEEEDEGVDGLDFSGDAPKQRSSHEKQRARIADEIRRLEAANVAKKDWTLAGEARAVERPINSLIEEDLDFERVGKPVPVATNETTEDIEQLVKARILAKEFDEVIRRRPGASDAEAPRKSRFELADTKPQQGLAEMYETEHLRATDPNYVDSKDRKLMREHAEIDSLWKDVSSQLDTLCNWHYKPKVPQASINVVTDAPTIMMEEARPTAGSAAGGPSALAPQEIYAPGDDGRVAGEMVLRTGATISKDEMTREDKARARRHKKSQRKTDGEPTRQTGKSSEKQQLVSDLKKGGVKVINKEGQVTDMSGERVGADVKNSADALKL
jgi:U3 small nucleolar RNA-associated protein MPP10